MAAALAAAISVSTLSAATTTWTNAGDGTWETGSNWSGGAPDTNDIAFLGGSTTRTITISGTTEAIASLQSTNTNNSAWVLTNGILAFRTNENGSITTALNGNNTSLAIHSQISANNLVITGSRLDIYNTNNDITGTITLQTSSRVIFRTPGTAGSATINLRNSTQAQLGAGVFTNDIQLQGSSLGIYGFGLNNKTLEVAGTISEVGGSRNMVFAALNDNATIVISGNNSYTGNTSIGRNSAGSTTTIRITHGNAFGSSNSVTDVAFLSISNNGPQTLEMAGGITVVNRNLTLFGEGIGSKGSLYNADGNNTWDGGMNLGTVDNATIGVTNGTTLTVKGAISGSAVGGLTKAGAGALVLEGDNTFTTGTTVSAGTLELKASSGSALGSTASVSVGSGATLLISKSDQVNNSAGVTLSGGTIKRDSGVSEVFGNLNLTAGSSLDYGSGTAGTLQFGTYTPSSLLTVNNFFVGNELVFSSNLSSEVTNGSYFTFDHGFTSNWDGSTFTITAIPEPSAYVASVALIGLMLLPFGFGSWMKGARFVRR